MRHEVQTSPLSHSRRVLLLGGAAIATAAAVQAWAGTSGNKITVYKTPTCGCCSAWIEHLKASGFEAQIMNRPDLAPIRARFGAPVDLRSCHIATTGRYVIEGHVPAISIKKLLASKPDAVGVFVPGMPLGSPGMESPYKGQPYEVILLQKSGVREVFDRYEV